MITLLQYISTCVLHMFIMILQFLRRYGTQHARVLIMWTKYCKWLTVSASPVIMYWKTWAFTYGTKAGCLSRLSTTLSGCCLASLCFANIFRFRLGFLHNCFCCNQHKMSHWALQDICVMYSFLCLVFTSTPQISIRNIQLLFVSLHVWTITYINHCNHLNSKAEEIKNGISHSCIICHFISSYRELLLLWLEDCHFHLSPFKSSLSGCRIMKAFLKLFVLLRVSRCDAHCDGVGRKEICFWRDSFGSKLQRRDLWG